MEISNNQFERLHSHRFAREIIKSVKPLNDLWVEIETAITSITEKEIANRLDAINITKKTGRNKSIAPAINSLLDERLSEAKWVSQSDIFTSIDVIGSLVESELEDSVDDLNDFEIDGLGKRKKSSTWTLDFSKSISMPDGKHSGMAVEVAFNHAEAAAWNLAKPVIASELNDVRLKTRIGEGVGVVIVASSELKYVGNFDGATGDFRRYLKTLNAMRSQLISPILLVPLAAPKTFRIQRKSAKKNAPPQGTVIWI